jgi:hypothetical protein
MELETQTTENVALYSQWVRMWNGELELSDQIIGDDFIAHLAADAPRPQGELRNASTVRAWVDAVRSRSDEMTYKLRDGPVVSGSTVLAYWQARGRARTTDRSMADFAKSGVDILRVANGKFVEYWTANFNTAGTALAHRHPAHQP